MSNEAASNAAFWSIQAQLKNSEEDMCCFAKEAAMTEEDITETNNQMMQLADRVDQLHLILDELMLQKGDAERRQAAAHAAMCSLKRRLAYPQHLDLDLQLSIMHKSGRGGRVKAAMTCKTLRDTVNHGIRSGMFRVKAVAVSAGLSHTAVLTEDGETITFGYGASGQLGHGAYNEIGDYNHHMVPRVVQSLVEHRVGRVAVGGLCTAAVTTDGTLFTCGYGRDGRLGHGPILNNVPLPQAADPVQTLITHKLMTLITALT